MENNEVKKLCRIFKELDKIEDKMNPEIFEEIRTRLAESSSYKGMFLIILEENREQKLKNLKKEQEEK